MRPVAELAVRAERTAGRRPPAAWLAEAEEWGRAEESGCREAAEDEELVAARAICPRASRPADAAVADVWRRPVALRALPMQARPPVAGTADWCTVAAAIAPWWMGNLGTFTIAAASVASAR